MKYYQSLTKLNMQSDWPINDENYTSNSNNEEVKSHNEVDKYETPNKINLREPKKTMLV